VYIEGGGGGVRGRRQEMDGGTERERGRLLETSG